MIIERKGIVFLFPNPVCPPSGQRKMVCLDFTNSHSTLHEEWPFGYPLISRWAVHLKDSRSALIELIEWNV